MSAENTEDNDMQAHCPSPSASCTRIGRPCSMPLRWRHCRSS
jgi:hypothetical protein